jgi:predicted ester cyclase
MSTAESARELVARFYDEVLNQKRLAVVDELIAGDFAEHGTPPLPPGIDGFREFVRGVIAAFPDFEFTVHDWVVEGDLVAARCSARGTHLGKFLGFAATGRQVSWTAIHIWRIVDGRLAERWSEADVLGITEQLSAP